MIEMSGGIRSILILPAAIAVLLTGCTSERQDAAQKRKPAVYSVRADASYKLRSCQASGNGQARAIARQSADMTASWLEILGYIRRCDIDQVRYYNGPESFSAVVQPLSLLQQYGTPNCRREAARVKSGLTDARARIARMESQLTRICQVGDIMGDLKAARARLDVALDGLCLRMANIGARGVC